MGGKNSMWHKPFGAGSGSVNHAVTNIVGKDGKKILDIGTGILVGGALGAGAGAAAGAGSLSGTMGGAGMGAIAGGTIGANSASGGTLLGGRESTLNTSGSINPTMVKGFLEEGERRGEIGVGGTMAEMGEGRKDVRQRLQDIVDGKSAATASLKDSQARKERDMRSQQKLSGRGQTDSAQIDQLQRQQGMDLATQKQNEQKAAISALSREYRGGLSDIMRSSGQWGSILVGAQPPAMPQEEGGGLLSNLFGGLF